MRHAIATILIATAAALPAQTIRSGMPSVHALVAGSPVAAPVIVYAPVLTSPNVSSYPALSSPGSVVVEYTVDTAGVPQNPHVVQTLNAFADARVLAVVRQYRYQPGTLNGKAVDFPVRLSVNFGE